MGKVELALKRVVAFLAAGILVSCNLPTTDPVITSVAIDGDCNVRVSYVDHAPVDDHTYVFLRRMEGDDEDLSSLIYTNIAPAHGDEPSSFLDVNVPDGTYQYRLMVSSDKNRYSNFSSPVTITNAACANFEHIQMPLNPYPPEVTIANKCDVHVEVIMRGISLASHYRLYRESLTEPQKMVIEEKITITGNEFGQTFVYDDQNLAPGTYVYQASMYREAGQLGPEGESFGERSQPVTISDSVCPEMQNPGDQPSVQLELTPVEPVANITLVPMPDACIWQAAVDMFIRRGPNPSLYDDLTDVRRGTMLPVVGQSEDGQFWVVEVGTGATGYVSKSEKYSSMSGSCENVPTLKDPPPPQNSLPASTEKPAAATTATAPGLDIPIFVMPFTATPRAPVP